MTEWAEEEMIPYQKVGRSDNGRDEYSQEMLIEKNVE